MSSATRELKSAAADIQRYARRIRLDPKAEDVETWARRIARLADDLETIARKIEREERRP